MRASLTDRGLLRAVLVAFAFFLAYRSLAEVVTTALLLATGLLLAVALSAPVEALHRRKVPRTVSVALLAAPAMVVAGVLVNELWFRRLEGSEGNPEGEFEGAG